MHIYITFKIFVVIVMFYMIQIDLMNLRAEVSGAILDDSTGELAWDFVNSSDDVLVRIARMTLKQLKKIRN